MRQQRLAEAYIHWLDQICSDAIPATAVAFNVNLYDGMDAFQAELIGASRYDADDPDWPCAEVFASRPNLFALPRTVVKGKWSAALDLFTEWTREYCLNRKNKGEPLRNAQAVAVGFVDGDLNRVWPPETAP